MAHATTHNRSSLPLPLSCWHSITANQHAARRFTLLFDEIYMLTYALGGYFVVSRRTKRKPPWLSLARTAAQRGNTAHPTRQPKKPHCPPVLYINAWLAQGQGLARLCKKKNQVPSGKAEIKREGPSQAHSREPGRVDHRHFFWWLQTPRPMFNKYTRVYTYIYMSYPRVHTL